MLPLRAMRQIDYTTVCTKIRLDSPILYLISINRLDMSTDAVARLTEHRYGGWEMPDVNEFYCTNPEYG